MKNKIDIKVIFIFVLAVLLILSFVFRPSKQIDTHEDELKQLQIENEELRKSNVDLKIINEGLNKEIAKLIIDIDSTQAILAITEDKIKDLEDDKSKVGDYVSTLDADGISESLTEYLNKR